MRAIYITRVVKRVLIDFRIFIHQWKFLEQKGKLVEFARMNSI